MVCRRHIKHYSITPLQKPSAVLLLPQVDGRRVFFHGRGRLRTVERVAVPVARDVVAELSDGAHRGEPTNLRSDTGEVARRDLVATVLVDEAPLDHEQLVDCQQTHDGPEDLLAAHLAERVVEAVLDDVGGPVEDGREHCYS